MRAPHSCPLQDVYAITRAIKEHLDRCAHTRGKQFENISSYTNMKHVGA